MTPRALKIAVVSPDRNSLRALSWLLNAFGYQTVSSVELASVVNGLADHADMLILDADFSDLSLSKSPLLRRSEGRYIYTLLMCNPRKMPNITDALEWGVDDLLQKPVNNGEVLSRLRAGARFLEFERRLEEQATRDPLTHLLTQSGLLAAMRKMADADRVRTGSSVLIVADLDHFALVDEQHGRKQADEALLAVTKVLRGVAKKKGRLARLSEDRFALCIGGGKEGDGAALAEAVRESIEELSIDIGNETLRLTASVAYADFDPECDLPLEVLDLATDALAHAKCSGRNCVVRAGELDAAFSEWRRELNAGNPFVSVTARDVMQPFGTFLKRDVDFRRTRNQLLKSALEYFAIVDGESSLVGTIHRDELAGHGPKSDHNETTASRLPLHKPFAVTEETPFGDLVERFTTEDDPLVVVVRDREPRGFITREGFLNLIEPIHTGSFRPSTPFSPSTAYLVVPEYVALAEEVEA